MMKKRQKREGKKKERKGGKEGKGDREGKGERKGENRSFQVHTRFPSAPWDLASLKLIMTLDKNPTSPHLSVETP